MGSIKYHFRVILTIIIVFNFIIALLSSNETHNFACPFFLYKFNTVCKKNFVILVVVVVPFLVFYAFLLRYMLFYTCKLTRSNILHWWIVDHVALHTHIHTRTPHPTLRYDTVASRYINVTIWSSLSCER